MKSKSGKDIQVIISYAVFVLSGFLIFSPIHKSENIPLSLLCAVIVSGISLYIILYLFSTKKHTQNIRPLLCFITAIIASLTSLFVSLMLITEIIKDVAYIANRGVSLSYYTFIALAMLLVSCYLCTSKDTGVYRFTILSSLVFLFLFIIMFFALCTTKSITVVVSTVRTSYLSPILIGIKAGIFYTVDSAVFFFTFKELLTTENKNFPKKQIYLGFISSYTFIIIYNLFTLFIFGHLTSEIQDPDYALIKLVQGIDLTEIVSAVRIVSFLIKSSTYIYLSSVCLKSTLPKIKLCQRKIILLLYLMIPFTFLILAFFDKSLKYGAFQHLIYPTNFIMALSFIILYRFIEKKKE